MIINCICGKKKFRLSDELMPREGSKVRCGSCSEVWFFHPNKGNIEQDYNDVNDAAVDNLSENAQSETVETPPIETNIDQEINSDLIEKNGEINDTDRIDYFKKYLTAVKKSIDDGAKVKSYFAWTFMDNFEWALGFEKRFGIVHVDFKTLKRTPKKSYYFFKKLVEENSIPLDF